MEKLIDSVAKVDDLVSFVVFAACLQILTGARKARQPQQHTPPSQHPRPAKFARRSTRSPRTRSRSTAVNNKVSVRWTGVGTTEKQGMFGGFLSFGERCRLFVLVSLSSAP